MPPLNPLDELRRHCVVDLYGDLVQEGSPRGREALGRAYQICNRSLQQNGFMYPNTERPTPRGVARSLAMWNAPGSWQIRRRFEQILAEARASAGSANDPVELPMGPAEIKRYLKPLRAAMDKVFACDTAYGDCHPDRPSAGHCMLAAMALQDLFGGTIVQGEVKQIPHYWNRFGRMEVDVTGDQFGKGFAPIRVKCGQLHRKPEPYEFFRRPYESLEQPINFVACSMHDRFIKRLATQLHKDGHPVWADVLSRGGCVQE